MIRGCRAHLQDYFVNQELMRFIWVKSQEYEEIKRMIDELTQEAECIGYPVGLEKP